MAKAHIKKITLCFGSLIFFLFAALQINDAEQYGNADAWSWIAIYTTMAILNLAMLWLHPAKHWLFAWAGFTWGALFFRIQDDQGNMHVEWLHPANYWADTGDGGTTMVQHANESGGLLILALWACLTCYLGTIRKPS